MTSLRKHPELRAIFKAAESRQLTPQELDEYCRVVPEFIARAQAAREVGRNELSVIKTVVDEIFAIYPYEQHHKFASAKANRDIRMVSAYATQAMLMNDLNWNRDKLLIWLKTILQAFEFPDREHKKTVLFAAGSSDNTLRTLKPGQRSIYETYTKLKQRYQAVLTTTAFELMEPYLQQAIDILPLN